MALPNPTKSRTWDLGTSANGTFFDTEFNQLYANDVYLYSGGNVHDASAATIADADEIGFWQIAGSVLKKITFANFKVVLDAVYSRAPKYAYLADIKSVNSSGGSSTSGSRQTRTLDEITDPDSIVTVSSNVFTLGAGRYRIKFRAPAFKPGAFRAWLFNTTDSADAITGNTSYSVNDSSVQVDSGGEDTLTLSGTKSFRVETQVGVSQATNGLGTPANMTSSEVYTEVWITKIS